MNTERQTSTTNTREKGKTAEELAAEYLKNKGMVIVRRNFHFGREGEIDLIARDGDILVFVEVKSRRSNEFGTPEEGITFAKRKYLRHAAEGYLYVNKLDDCECRFDFVGVDYAKNPAELRHIINAF